MLINYRKDANLTQRALARAVGVSPTTISRIERVQSGNRETSVHYTTSAGFRRVLGETTADILSGVTTTHAGKPAGGYDAPHERNREICTGCNYALPRSRRCDYCGTD